MKNYAVTISVTVGEDDYQALIGVLSKASGHDPLLVGLAEHMVALVKLVEDKNNANL